MASTVEGLNGLDGQVYGSAGEDDHDAILLDRDPEAQDATYLTERVQV
ncbi:MAG: hypothetical protein ACREL7_03035 [Longimicrobiales bacterium]